MAVILHTPTKHTTDMYEIAILQVLTLSLRYLKRDFRLCIFITESVIPRIPTWVMFRVLQVNSTEVYDFPVHVRLRKEGGEDTKQL